jgi:hypothetical protein
MDDFRFRWLGAFCWTADLPGRRLSGTLTRIFPQSRWPEDVRHGRPESNVSVEADSMRASIVEGGGQTGCACRLRVGCSQPDFGDHE